MQKDARYSVDTHFISCYDGEPISVITEVPVGIFIEKADNDV